MALRIAAAFGLRWVARLSRNEEDQKTIRGIVFPTNDVALVQGRGQLGLDIAVEDRAVHCPAEHPGRVQPVMAQRGDEGLGLPVAEGGMIDQACPAWRPSGGLGHIGLEGSFVDERQPCQHVTQCERKAIDPGDQS